MKTAITLAVQFGIDAFNQTLLSAIKNGNNFANIDISCPELLTGGKKNPMQGRIIKHTIGLRVEIATDSVINSYEARYNRDLETNGHDGTYTIKPHAYAVRYGKDTATMHHKTNGTPYMRYFMQDNQSGAETYYTLDNKRIDKDKIEGLKVKKASIMPETKGTTCEVKRPNYRLVKTENIVAIRAGKKELTADMWSVNTMDIAA